MDNKEAIRNLLAAVKEITANSVPIEGRTLSAREDEFKRLGMKWQADDMKDTMQYMLKRLDKLEKEYSREDLYDIRNVSQDMRLLKESQRMLDKTSEYIAKLLKGRKANKINAAAWFQELEDFYGKKAVPTPKDYQAVDKMTSWAMSKAMKELGITARPRIVTREMDEASRKYEVQWAKDIIRRYKSPATLYRVGRAAEDENYHSVAEVLILHAEKLWRKGIR